MKKVLSTDPDGTRLPIKLDTTSNGEFTPVPLSRANREANRLAFASADENAKRLGIKRRQFLVSACGAASTLLAFNQANAAAGKSGGFFELPKEAALEPLRARVFGLNAARVYGLNAAEVRKYTGSDAIARERVAYLQRPDPHFRTYGPKTRREFLAFTACCK